MGSGFSNDVCIAKNFNTLDDGTKTAQITTDGQLLIGATVAPNVRVGTITSIGGTITITPGPGTLDLATSGAAIDINGLTGYPLTVPHGGTARTTFPQGAILLGEATNPLNSVQLAAGQLAIGTAIGSDPVANSLTAGLNTVITLGVGSISIASLIGSPVLSYTESATTPFVVLPTHNVIGIDCSGAIKTVHLPNAPTNTGNSWTIKDYTGSCAANNITVTTPGGAVLIDGAATYVMNVAYASITVVWSGTAYRVI